MSAWWHHPLHHIHPYYPAPPSSSPPSSSSCLFLSAQKVSPDRLLRPLSTHHIPSRLLPAMVWHGRRKIYSSTGGFSLSFSYMLWRRFPLTSLRFLTTPLPPVVLPLPQDGESTMVRGKAPLDPPCLPPSGQGGLSQPERAKEGETHTGAAFFFSRPDVRTAAVRNQFGKRHLSHGIATVCVCVYGNALVLCVPVCVFSDASWCIWSLSWTLSLTVYIYSPSVTPKTPFWILPFRLPNLLPGITYNSVYVCESN